MKKILCLCFLFLFSTFKVYSADIKIVQIDSLKFSPESAESVANFAKTIDEINNQKNVDFVIFTGNNIAKSNKQHLEQFLKNANRLHSPYFIALGHKDLNKRKGLSKTAYMDIARKKIHVKTSSPNYVFIKKKVVFIAADGAKEFIQTPFGYYRDDVITFLDSEISKYPKKNVVILQHFPIYPPDDREAFRTYNADRYLEMLGKHDNVKAVISGFGVNSENDVNGIKHITTADYPAYRIIEIIDCDGKSPTIWSTLK